MHSEREKYFTDVRKDFGWAPVGTGHARDQKFRGHGPFLREIA